MRHLRHRAELRQVLEGDEFVVCSEGGQEAAYVRHEERRVEVDIPRDGGGVVPQEPVLNARV